ncbi:pilus assembly PilX family protein [Microbulbifer hainanensis]|uniref:pilus assembly PilX family protein n=1 Tax=Microbulbifer hainanensis TaxID=2735675 RepID=UPI0018686EA8|nr:PilX N-terminal domain-containing pilus assembly protein [Microbulbifer hainanensis]
MNNFSLGRQRGAVLVICMIILLMLTLIGVSGARSVILQEKMTSASRDAQLALQVAESTVRAAEKDVNGLVDTSAFSASGTDGLYTEGDAPADLFAAATWNAGVSRDVTITMDGKTFTGHYFIEMAGEIDPEAVAGKTEVAGTNNVVASSGNIKVFRIVAMGEGLAKTERVIVTHHGKLL